MLNNKNTARCLEYADERFAHTFVKQEGALAKNDFNIHNRVKLFMVQTMFNVIFGTDLDTFIDETSQFNKTKFTNLHHTQQVANKFGDAFHEYESFSLLKFFAMTLSELAVLWRFMDKFKRFFNAHVCRVGFFSDPMDWFVENFINKHLQLYSDTKDASASSLNTSDPKYPTRRFGYLNSFLYLTYNPIFKYNQAETTQRRTSILNQFRKRAFTTTDFNAISEAPSSMPPFIYDKKLRCYSNDLSNSPDNNVEKKFRSTRFSVSSESRSRIKSSLSTNYLTTELETEEFENWKLSINEALSNTLLMFFAGYETTSSAIAFCCHVLIQMPEQKTKLLEEIGVYSKRLNLKHQTKPKAQAVSEEENATSSGDGETSLDDDVFEEDDDESDQLHNSNGKKNASKSSDNTEHWNELHNTLEQMKYLDMFVKEVLRMFPIANSMVSRKCMVDDLYLDEGNYHIPFGMNVVVDVLSIHYDPVIWGPVDPETFYPERFLTKRNPAAFLPFGWHKLIEIVFFLFC